MGSFKLSSWYEATLDSYVYGVDVGNKVVIFDKYGEFVTENIIGHYDESLEFNDVLSNSWN